MGALRDLLKGDTYIIELNTLWGRVKNKFSISLSTPFRFWLFPFAFFVTQLDKLLQAYEVYAEDNLVATSTGAKVIITVPSKIRYRIYGFHIEKSAGTGTVNNILVRDAANTIATRIFSQTAASTLYTELFNQVVILNPGMIIMLNIAAVTTTVTFTIRWYGSKEKY